MKLLTPKLWASFKERRTKGQWVFNGVKFEELVRELLSAYFDGAWEPTSITWDGGKDFVSRSIVNKQSWAECKMYEKRLSIRIISNSLVMAINENVEELLFFSYSELNPNAISHLSTFSSNTNIKVRIFDDCLLERLILKSRRITKKYFGDVTGHNLIVYTKEIEIHSFFSADTNVEYSQLSEMEGVNKKRDPSIPINTPCLYEISIRSHASDKEVNLKIDFRRIESKRQELGILNLNYYKTDTNGILNITLSKGEIRSIKLFICPSVPGIIEIPSVAIKSSGGNDILPPIPINVTRLNRPSLIGTKLVTDLKNFKDRISASNIISTTVISGKSGVGKSRFLEEADIRLLSQNFISLKFDGHSIACENFQSFVGNLLSQIWRLPNVQILKSNSEDSFTYNLSGDTIFDRVCAVVLSLQANHDPSRKKIEEVYELAIEGILKQRMALLVDNVQSLDNASLHLMSMIFERLNGAVGQGTLVLAFNEDELIYSNAAAVLHQRLKDTSQRTNKNSITFIPLFEFDKRDVVSFLDTVCAHIDAHTSFTNHYPGITELIYENVLPRPLDLFQLFLTAQDEKIAFVQDGFFFIRNIDAFHILLKSVNKTTENIFSQRLHHLQGDGNAILILLALSCLGDIDIDRLSTITAVTTSHIKNLLNQGWLKNLDGNKVEFFHPSLERFVIKAISGESIEKFQAFTFNLKTKLVNGLNEHGYGDQFRLAIFYLSKRKTKDITLGALKELRKFDTSPSTARNRMFSSSLYSFLLTNRTLAPSLYLDSIQTICKLASGGKISDLCERLLAYRNSLASFLPATDSEALALVQITRQYASYSNLIGQPERGDQKLIQELTRIGVLSDVISNETKERMKVNLLNRRCVCLKEMGRFQEAKEIGREALNISMRNSFHDYTCLTLLDISVTQKSEKRNANQYILSVNKAIQFFIQHKQTIDDWSIELSCWENKARIASLNGEYKVAVKYAERVIKVSREKNDIYYLLRGLSTKAIFMAQSELSKKRLNKGAIGQIRYLTYELEDLAVTSRMERFYIKALHLHAIIATALKEYNRAKDLYTSILSRIRESKSKNYISFEKRAAIIDAANFWRVGSSNDSFPLSPGFLYQTNLGTVAKSVGSHRFIKPTMLFSTEKFNFPFP